MENSVLLKGLIVQEPNSESCLDLIFAATLKGGQVDCMEVVLCLSQKVAKNGQILSMFVPKKWLFSLLLQPHQGWLFKSKNWLMSKICQPLSFVSGFFRSYWFGLLHCHIMDTERSSQPLSLI